MAAVIKVIQEQEVDSIEGLKDICWGQAHKILKEIYRAGLEDELLSFLSESSKDGTWTVADLNDLLAYDWKYVYAAIGMNEEDEEEDEEDEETFACGGKKKKFSDFEDKVEAFNKSGEHDIADAIAEFCWDFWEDKLYHTHNGDGIPEPYTKQFQDWLDDTNEEAIEAKLEPMKLVEDTDVDPYKCYVVQNYNCFKDNDWHLINEGQVKKYALCEIPEIEFARWAKACHIDL